MQSEETLKNFGIQVKQYRKTAGLSQEQLADLAEVHRTYLSGIERGERNVSLINIVRISKALKISPSKLLENID